MLKRKAIEKTVVVYWSEEDQSFIAESSLFPRITATGDSKSKALKEFRQSLDDVYEYVESGKIAGYNKRGRPAKGGVNMHIQVRPDTKKFIDHFRLNLDISQGEVIDYLSAFVQAANYSSSTTKTANSSVGTMERKPQPLQITLRQRQKKRSA